MLRNIFRTSALVLTAVVAGLQAGRALAGVARVHSVVAFSAALAPAGPERLIQAQQSADDIRTIKGVQRYLKAEGLFQPEALRVSYFDLIPPKYATRLKEVLLSVGGAPFASRPMNLME